MIMEYRVDTNTGHIWQHDNTDKFTEMYKKFWDTLLPIEIPPNHTKDSFEKILIFIYGGESYIKYIPLESYKMVFLDFSKENIETGNGI